MADQVRPGRASRRSGTRPGRRRALALSVATLAVAAMTALGVAQPGYADGTPSDPSVQEPAATYAAAVPEAGPGPTPGSPADAGDFELVSGSDLSGRIADLDAALYKQGVQNLLDPVRANRHLSTNSDVFSACPQTDPFGALAPSPAVKYCWENDDATSTEWVPQGITGVSDAQADEFWGSSQPIITASYDNANPDRSTCGPDTSDACNEKGVRVTFIDPSTKVYRHVLLVWPYYNSYDHISFAALHASDSTDPPQSGIHAGGLAWYGNYLYVPDTLNGLRVFDMRDIMDLNPDDDATTNDATQDGLTSNVNDKYQVGRQNNVWYSYGYRYVMPQVATWHFAAPQSNVNGNGDHCVSTGAPKASYVSIDRSDDDTLTMGEYCNPDADYPTYGRIASFPLDDATGQLESSASAGKEYAHATDAYHLLHPNIQGAVKTGAYPDERFYLNHSGGAENNGTLYSDERDSSGDLAAVTHQPTAVGPEDLYLDTTGGSPLLWSVTERAEGADPGCDAGYPCGRVLFAYPLPNNPN